MQTLGAPLLPRGAEKEGCDHAIPNPERLSVGFEFKIKALLTNRALTYRTGCSANSLDERLFVETWVEVHAPPSI